MTRTVCPISGHICFDSEGVRANLATRARLMPDQRPPGVYRCSQAIMHPERPYHVGERRNLRRAGRAAA